MPPPSKRLSPVCKVSSIGCSTMIGSGAVGCVACQAASALSSLAGSVSSNHHCLMANSSRRCQPGLPKLINAFLLGWHAVHETPSRMMLLSRSGDKAISSDAAAMTDPKCWMGQELHGQMRGCASSLLTRCSTELRRPKVSFLSSRKSKCITSSCVAMCSTAEVKRTTASCWL
jgi:hypothetical protein